MTGTTGHFSERLKKELDLLKNEQNRYTGKIISESPQMKQILQTAKRIGTVDTTVMILGESGVGKEVLADYLVQNSTRKDRQHIQLYTE